MFKNKRALVTGASRGIGLAVADAFLANGADVSILARSNSVHSVAEELGNKHQRKVDAIQCDITDIEMVEKEISKISSIDILVNNAGVELITPIDDTSSECARKFQNIINTNILGTYYVTRSSVAKMGSGGRIVITSSIWGKSAVAEFSAYCASKHANIGFMRSLAWELAPKGITVNAVCPGWVRTTAAMRSLEVMSKRAKVPAEEMLADVVANQAIGGLLEPEDIVGPYLFLASDAAADVTGQALNVDRGEVMF